MILPFHWPLGAYAEYFIKICKAELPLEYGWLVTSITYSQWETQT